MLRLTVLLGVLALALGGCGGDDSGNESPARDKTATQTDTNAARTDTNAKTATSKKKKTQGEPEIHLENSEPAPPLSERKRKKREQDLPTGAPTPKQDLTAKEKQIYEISLFFCKEEGIEGMRREYGIKSSDPEDIAREAAKRTYGRGGAEAVYSGCLEGLRQSK
jgi:hypothetical protein